MEVYESHLGGIYFTTEVLTNAETYCDQCGDYDFHLGHADSWEEVLALITDEDGDCIYDEEYVKAIYEDFRRCINEDESD